MVEEYRFGSITIDGEIYNQDVEVRFLNSETEVLEWRKEESHRIDVQSVKRTVEQKPEVIVIGTGESGAAQISEEAKEFIAESGIKLISDITAEAVKTFNVIQQDSLEEEGEQTRIIGLFHLTC